MKVRGESRNTKAGALPRTWYQEKLKPFLERRSLALAACFIAIAVIRIAATYSAMGITFDEPSHFACGMELVVKHVYRWEPLHPPLARVMTAVLPYLAGVRPTTLETYNGTKVQMGQSGALTLFQDGHPLRNLVLARLGILPFLILACAVVYLWALRWFGKAVAAVATALFTLLPPVLAHGGLATTDMALTSCLGAAFLALMVWAESPSLRSGLLLGAATAAAILSKFTALGFLPMAALLALVVYLAVERPGFHRLRKLTIERLPSFAVAIVAAAVIVWSCYLFSFGVPSGWHIRVPAPEFFSGLHQALLRGYEQGGGYLFGTYSPHGFWYFFLAAIALKTPLAILALLLVGATVCWKNRRQTKFWLPLAFAAGVLIPAMTSTLNLGVRHVLPVYIAFAIVAAWGLEHFLSSSGIVPRSAAALLPLWLIVSGALQHPNYLAYFSEFVGGEPENVMVDSDYDWGQDTPILAKRLRDLGVTHVGFKTYDLDSRILQQWPGLPPTEAVDPMTPHEGWTAISPTLWKEIQYGMYHRYPNREPWFAYRRPADKAGAFLLYYVPQGGFQR